MTYLAFHEFLDQTLVAKLLPRRVEIASDPAANRIRREAAIGFRVSDPAVVRVIDADEVDGIRFLVMEHIEGVDLQQLLDGGFRLSPEQVACMAHEILGGLAALHRAGLVHRDIKPSNLMLGNDGRARVIDLSVVGLADQPGGCASPDRLGSAGTFAYAAPELHLPGGRADARCDLYALGVVLFQLCTGRAPFDMARPFQGLLERHSRAASWPGDAVDCPEWLRDRILALLRADPGERPASAERLREEIGAGLGRSARDRIAAAEDDAPTGVVVGQFEDEQDGLERWLGLALAQSLARRLSSDPDLYVADSDEMLRVLERMHGSTGSPPLERRCAAARLLGASHLIEGRYRQVKGMLRVRLTVTSTVDQRQAEIETTEGPTTKLGELRRELLRRIYSELKRVAAGPAESPDSVREMGVAAQERFFRGKQAYLDGDYEEAGRLGREAITLDPDFGEAVGFVGVCAAKTGRYDEAAEYLGRQQQIANETADARLAVEGLANLGAMHYYRGQYERAFGSYAAAAQAARDGGFRSDLAKISSNLGFVLLQLGRRDQAETAYRKAIETHQSAGARASLIGPFNGLGNVLREQGRHEDAALLHRGAIRLSLEAHDQVNLGIAYMYLGRCESERGRFRNAKRSFAVALSVLEGTRFWNGLTRLYSYLAELNLQQRSGREALRAADRMIELARRHKNERLEKSGMELRERAAQLPAEGLSSAQRVWRQTDAREVVALGES